MSRYSQKIFSLLVLLLTSNLGIVYAGTVSLDTTFNGSGYRVQQVSAASGAYSESIAISPDGKIVLGGFIWSDSGPADFIALRLNSNGNPDTGFSGDGIVTTNLGPFDAARKVLVQPDLKIILAGDRYFGSTNNDFALTRYDTVGNLDSSFDGNGVAAPTISGFSYEAGMDAILQPDGKIIVAGLTAPVVNPELPFPPSDLALMRLNSDGSLDPTFNGTGIVTVVFNNVSESINSIALQPDGKIIVGGYVYIGTKKNFLIMRFGSNGVLDTSFGSAGMIITSVSALDDEVSSVAVQNDGKILAAGSGKVLRFLEDGSTDTAFGNAGSVSVQQSTDKIVINADNSIFVAGIFNSKITVRRLNSAGAIDSTFNSGSYAITIPNVSCLSADLIVDSSGKLVFSGSCTQSSLPVFAAARLVETTQRKTLFDFDGDSKTDVSVFRPSAGEWWVLKSGNSSVFGAAFGTSTDKPTPADFTGDGKTDVAFFRPSTGFWFVIRSEDNTFFGFPFGTNGDVPAVGDFDADGKADQAVFRNGTWFLNQSTQGFSAVPFGTSGDVPVAADYDGDGKTDVAIFRPAPGEWWILRSSNSTIFAAQFGSSTDKVVQGDYTGDGKADVAFFRPSTGFWFVLRSEDQSFFGFPFGASGDVPAPGDYDGDGKTDAAVFRSGTWFLNRSTQGFAAVSFGTSGDIPTPASFIP